MTTDDAVILVPLGEVVLEPIVDLPARRGFAGAILRALKWLGRLIASVSDWLFGAVALTAGLSLLAATPLAQLLAFGYLLEASGRVSRTGKLRAGLIGVRKASRVGSMVIGVVLFLIPLWVLSSLANGRRLSTQEARRLGPGRFC